MQSTIPAWRKTHLWQFRQRRSTVLHAQKASESHVSFTMPANALVPGIRVSLYFEQWLPWTRFVRSPWRSHNNVKQYKGILYTYQHQLNIKMIPTSHTSAKHDYTVNIYFLRQCKDNYQQLTLLHFVPPDGGVSLLYRSVNENVSLVYTTLGGPDQHCCVKTSCRHLSFLISPMQQL